MKRKIYNEMLDWKNNEKENRPLMILGVRQCGKTYIIQKFCQNEYKNFIEVNLFERQDIIDLYKSNKTSEEKFRLLKIYIDFYLEKENTVLFIDEIQECEELISELKFFCEKHNNIKIICAGSLLGVKLNRMYTSFPVGKVKLLNLYPMDFEEFLTALGHDNLILEIKNHYNNNKPFLESLHNKALDLYKNYLIIGGMPAYVKNYIENNQDLIKTDKTILNDIIEEYFKDMRKHIDNKSLSLKVEETYKSIPSQLSNESNKFQYTKISPKAKSRDYESVLDWLNSANLINTSYLVKLPEIPLEGFVNRDIFKLFISDVGILNNLLDIKPLDIINDNLSLYKGSITENYVANELLSNKFKLYYWQSSGIAELDFLIYNDDGIIPIEVKSSDNTQSKSLNVYIEKYKPKYSIRISQKNFGYNKDKNIKSVPLYAVFCIK